eukprot:Gb_02721 [translate_table: standard]
MSVSPSLVCHSHRLLVVTHKTIRRRVYNKSDYLQANSARSPKPVLDHNAKGLEKCDHIFMLIFCVAHAVDVIVEGYNPSERSALRTLIDNLKNNGNLHSNWTGPPCHNSQSQWIGVVCFDWNVTELVLDNMGLIGSIQENALLNLTQLKKLSLMNNDFYGPVPNLSTLVDSEAIYLSGNRFTGPISDSAFQNMMSLRKLWLNDNTLTGSIPSSLVNLNELREVQLQDNDLTGTIPLFNQATLKVFNVSNNNLEGRIPDTPVVQSFSENSFLGNPGLCGRPLSTPCVTPIPAPSCSPTPAPWNSGKKSKIWTITEIVVPSIAASIIITVIFFWYYRRMYAKKPTQKSTSSNKGEKKEQPSTSTSGDVVISQGEKISKTKLVFYSAEQPTFDLDDLLRASAELLGKGNFGSTYKAVLETGSCIVVKRLRELDNLGKKEFEQQMQLLGKLRHANLVPMIGYYYAKEEKLLIYNYMPNGSLFEHLHGNRGPGRILLDWKSRLKIAQGMARGLAYLHRQCEYQKTPHGNLKSSNILLGENCEPYLSDYGLEPLVGAHIAAQRITAYGAPEYLQSKKISQKADIWSFGILLLELLTGKLHRHSNLPHNHQAIDLPLWVNSVSRDQWKSEIFDLEIVVSEDAEGQMLRMFQIALTCTENTPDKRPKMSILLGEIEAIRESDEGKDNPSTGSEGKVSSYFSSKSHS